MIGRVVLIADFGIRSIKVWKHHDEAKCERVCTTIWSLTKAAGIKQQLQSAQVPARDVCDLIACSVTSRRHPPAMMISKHSPVGNWQGEAHVASCTGYTLLNIMIELLLNALLLLTRCIVAGQRRDAADVMMQGLHCRRESFVRIAIDINIVLMESFNSPKNRVPQVRAVQWKLDSTMQSALYLASTPSLLLRRANFIRNPASACYPLIRVLTGQASWFDALEWFETAHCLSMHVSGPDSS